MQILIGQYQESGKYGYLTSISIDRSVKSMLRANETYKVQISSTWGYTFTHLKRDIQALTPNAEVLIKSSGKVYRFREFFAKYPNLVKGTFEELYKCDANEELIQLGCIEEIDNETKGFITNYTRRLSRILEKEVPYHVAKEFIDNVYTDEIIMDNLKAGNFFSLFDDLWNEFVADLLRPKINRGLDILLKEQDYKKLISNCHFINLVGKVDYYSGDTDTDLTIRLTAFTCGRVDVKYIPSFKEMNFNQYNDKDIIRIFDDIVGRCNNTGILIGGDCIETLMELHDEKRLNVPHETFLKLLLPYCNELDEARYAVKVFLSSVPYEKKFNKLYSKLFGFDVEKYNKATALGKSLYFSIKVPNSMNYGIRLKYFVHFYLGCLSGVNKQDFDQDYEIFIEALELIMDKDLKIFYSFLLGDSQIDYKIPKYMERRILEGMFKEVLIKKDKRRLKAIVKRVVECKQSTAFNPDVIQDVMRNMSSEDKRYKQVLMELKMKR